MTAEAAGRQVPQRHADVNVTPAVRSAQVAIMPPYLILSAAIILEVVATSSLKASEGFTRLVPTLAVVVGYGLAFWLLSLTLRDIPVGLAYAIWSGAGIVLVSAFAWAALGQRLDAAGLIGIGLIVSGVLVINLFSSSTPH